MTALCSDSLYRLARRFFVHGFFVFSSSAFAADVSKTSGWELPESLAFTLESLPTDQQSFISSGDFLDYIPARQMVHELTTRKGEELSAMLSDLMGAAVQMGYNPDRDMGAMPLNTDTPNFRNPVIRPPVLRDENREPGPFGVHRYLFPESGVPTFAGAKVAIWPEDLIAGNVEVAIIGVPNDMGSGRRSAELGPGVMRAMNTLALPDVDSLLDPREVLSIVDYGDFAIDNMSTELTVDHVTEMVAQTADTGAIPMLVGGDTSMLYPGVKGVAKSHGHGKFGLVHFSAHPDSDREAVHTVSDEQALFMLLDEGIVSGEDVIAVGLRGPTVNVDTLQWLRGQKVRYHTMAEIRRKGYDAVMARVKEEVVKGPERLFVSIDVSVIMPSQMVAAGRISPNGLSVQEVASAIRYLCAEKQIVGFEITDMAPMLDFSRLSVINANTVLNACLVGLAVRKAGLSADYIHPFAIDHGQD
jgi:arginase family enzyme